MCYHIYMLWCSTWCKQTRLWAYTSLLLLLLESWVQAIGWEGLMWRVVVMVVMMVIDLCTAPYTVSLHYCPTWCRVVETIWAPTPTDSTSTYSRPPLRGLWGAVTSTESTGVVVLVMVTVCMQCGWWICKKKYIINN